MEPSRESRLRPTHLRRLERAVDWIRQRDPRIADHLENLEFAPSPLVGIVGSETEGELLVNPLAVADLSVEELAGALGAALLYTRVRESLSREERRTLLRRITALRGRVRMDRLGAGPEEEEEEEEEEEGEEGG